MFSSNDAALQASNCFLVDIATAAVPVYPFSGYSLELDVQGNAPGDGGTIVLGDITYTWRTSNAALAAYEVWRGTTPTNTEAIANLIAAITFDYGAGTGEGTDYGTGTVAHPDGYAVPSGLMLGNAAHFTSKEKLVVSESSGSFSFSDIYGVDNARTEMIKYGSGDYTGSYAQSSSYLVQRCRVLGMTPRVGTTGTKQGIYFTDGAGETAHAIEAILSISGTTIGGFAPVQARIGTGISAYWDATGSAAYIHWTHD